MDQSLDQIISAKPRNTRRGTGRRGAGAARAEVLGKAAPSPGQRARAAAAVAPVDPTKAITQASDKIIVSNLPQDVNEVQIRELFTQTVGPVKEITLNFDQKGHSKGVATVVFAKKADGQKAFQQYNNRLIDGKRPMKIEIVVDLSKPLPLASRVAPAPAAAASATVAAAGGRAGAGRGGRRPKRGGARKSERTPKTAADLDAEMEDYTSANQPAAA